MKSLSPSIRTTALLLAFAMPLTLDAETSASSAGGINLSTSGCGIDLDAPKHVCRNVDDDQPGPHEKHELWDIDHAPSEGENDLRMLTITGVAGLNGGNMTLEVPDEAEVGLIRFWKDPGKEEPAYQFSWEVDPFSFRQEEIWVEGYDVGKVRFKAKMTCYPSEVKTTTATTKVYEIDLDIDSLNDNADPYSADGYTDGEDRIEASEKEEDGLKKPGKIVVSGINVDADDDGTPDFADLTIPGGKFVPVQVTLKKPFDPEKAYVRFDYKESKPEESEEGWTVSGAGTASDPEIYTLHTGGMRLWKKDAPSRSASDFVPPDEDLPWTSIADGNSRTKILYLEYVDKETPEAAGRQDINITATEDSSESESGSASEDGATCEDKIVTTLVPIKLNGLDRYVEGRIPMAAMDMIGGIERLSLQFVAKDGSEIHGSFNGLGEAHIYDMEDQIGPEDDHIASDAEIAAFQGGSLDPKQYDDSAQDTVFWIENGEMVFATTFDNAVPIQVEVIRDSKLVGSVGYTLTPNEECSELIDILDATLAGIPFRNQPPQPPALLAAGSDGGETAQVQRFGIFKKLLRRNLVTKSMGAVFNKVKDHVVRGAVIAVTAVIENVKTNLVFGQGFVLGLWAGVQEDVLAVWGGVQVVYSLTTNPVETCAAFRRSFNELLGITWEEFKQIPGQLIDQFIADAEAKIAWAGPDNDLNLISYIAGYSTGYITEKVGLAILTGGASAAVSGSALGANLAAKFVKIIQLVRKGLPDKLLDAAKIAADAVKAANATKARLFRQMSQFTQDKAGISTLRKYLDERIKVCPTS